MCWFSETGRAPTNLAAGPGQIADKYYYYYGREIMKPKNLLIALISAVVWLGAAPQALAAKAQALSGTITDISVVQGQVKVASTDIHYGNTARVGATITGQPANNSLIYVTVVCTQGGWVVYQASNATDFTFPLVDQDGQGLDWDGGAAKCSATLIYRVQKGKEAVITWLAQQPFDVLP